VLYVGVAEPKLQPSGVVPGIRDTATLAAAAINNKSQYGLNCPDRSEANRHCS
jgi:hypothetical protein